MRVLVYWVLHRELSGVSPTSRRARKSYKFPNGYVTNLWREERATYANNGNNVN